MNDGGGMAKNGFGKLLREYREGAAKSMGALARELGVSVSYLSDVERGFRPPLVDDKIERAAAFLGAGASVLRKAAGETRGAFQLDVVNVSGRAREVGAMLSRQWPDISEKKLERLQQVLEEED
jgi:transcriptional regulator with XRE-family HTH domain